MTASTSSSLKKSPASTRRNVAKVKKAKNKNILQDELLNDGSLSPINKAIRMYPPIITLPRRKDNSTIITIPKKEPTLLEKI